MKARATSYSRDPNRWHGQRVHWKRHWGSRDVRRRRRRPLEQQERDEQNEPPRKSYGKVQVWETPPSVQVERVNRTRVGRDRLDFVDRLVVVQRRVVVLGIARVAVRTTVVHFLRYRCVVVLRH